MRWRPRDWTLMGVLMLAMPWIVAVATNAAWAQSPSIATTQVTDTIYRADGTAATGTVIVSWSAFTTASGQAVSSGSTSATIAAGGAFSVALAPNAGATPMGSYYTAVFHLDDGSVSREFWVVPVSTIAVRLSTIQSTVLPTSVAMQTVSKAYVDTAITAAVTGHPLDSSTPYVLKTGDAMTGPLDLPGDPTAATQAADKNYVDTNITAVASGLAQKVSLLPAATQTVGQPAGTDLKVNMLNGSEYASQYIDGRGDNGIANAVSSPDCTSGCDVKVEHSYNSNEVYNPRNWNSGFGGTHVEDNRNGEQRDSYLNPENTLLAGYDAGQVIDVVSTKSTEAEFQQNSAGDIFSVGLSITHEGLTGGSNLFPQDVDAAVPYFKTTYSALSVAGNYNTMGQHVLAPHTINCYGVGDCLIGSQFVTASGGFRDNADEGAHPFDLQVLEDTVVFQGTCSAGCTTGSTVVTVAPTAAPGTQGEGRYLIDKNPAKVISTGQLTGGGEAAPGATAAFSGTSFPLSTFFSTTQAIQSQADNVAPGTVAVAIATGGVTAGFATNTAALSGTTGIACVADMPYNFVPHNFEMANYSVVDGTHLQMTLNKAHAAGATIAVGGLCGYGLEQTVDTARGIRQVFPVIGSYSSTGLYYAGGLTSVVGRTGATGSFLNVALPVAAIARSGNVVTVTTAGNLPVDVSGLTLTVAGVADGSYNGNYNVTTTGPNTLTYAGSGANSTSSGGTISFLTGGYALYPMAEVLGVFNTATKSVDGQMTLAPNTVVWGTNDALEEPHYYQENIAADTEFVSQTTPRPGFLVHAGIQYQLNVGPGLHGFTINNAAPASNYLGNGGTHSIPDVAYEVEGVWGRTMEVQAGDESVFTVHCNSHGCGKWNSIYNLFELDSNAGVDTMSYQPTTSGLTLNLRGSSYGFTPQAFTAGTINAGTINATTLNGAVSAAQLPVFGASGSGHSQGAVPDPGAAAGTTRYLREDGSWSVPEGEGSGSGSGSSNGSALLSSGPLADYTFMDGAGGILTDHSGNGNNGTLLSGANAPEWTSTGLSFSGLNATSQGVSLPSALNGARTFLFVTSTRNLADSSVDSYAQYDLLLTNSTGYTGLNLWDQQRFTSWTYLASSPGISANANMVTVVPNLANGFHCKAFTLGTGSGDFDHIYIDGAEPGGYTQQGSSAGVQTSGNFFLGSAGPSVNPWQTANYAGTFYRARFYTAELTAEEVQNTCAGMVSEVASRGVATEPVKHPLGTPTIHAIGDSITCGFDDGINGCGLTPYANLLSLTNQPAYTIKNWGVPGSELQAIAASEPYRVAQECRSSNGPVIASVLAGTNDMTTYAPSATTLLGFLSSEVKTLKDAGCLVYVGTVVSIASGYDSAKDAYDTLLLQQWKSLGADGVIDFAANPLMGADGASANGTYFQGDGVHPTQAGIAQMAAAMSNALNYSFGYSETNPHSITSLPYSMAASDGYVGVSGVTAAGTLTLPDCTGQSGAIYRINNSQSAYAVTVSALNAAQPINGLPFATTVTVPANGTLTLRDVPNAKTVSGCHWEY